MTENVPREEGSVAKDFSRAIAVQGIEAREDGEKNLDRTLGHFGSDEWSCTRLQT